MCGIAAIYNKSPNQGLADVALRKSQLGNLLNSMRHRGPDGDGLYVSPRVSLGMVRLSIVGGDSGSQPIWNENRTIAVVCNGEIYNYRLLRNNLEQLGHVFSTQSDVEVILHLYEEYDLQCLEYLEGIFAFVLWDTKREVLLAARDRIGVKPLYYAGTNSGVVFASELRGLLNFPGIDLELDDSGFSAYHSFRFIPMSDTMLKGIKKLCPAEYMYIKSGKREFNFYWSAEQAVHAKKESHFSSKLNAKKLQDVMLRAVESQYADGVPSGVLLSGGMDSTALIAMQRRFASHELCAVTVSFSKPTALIQEQEYNEIGQASKVASLFNVHHMYEQYSANEVLSCLPSIVSALDEPIADPTAIPLWFATRLAKEAGLKVVYSGEGLDELFNGYEVYRQIYWLRAMRLLPIGLRKFLYGVIKEFPVPGAGLLARSLANPSTWYKGVGSVYSPDELQRLVTDAFMAEHRLPDSGVYVRQIMQAVQNDSPLTQMTYFDTFAWLPENTLAKSDKISMSNSIELRVPMLDRPIVEMALKMRDSDKLRWNRGKWIVRKALEGVIPEFVIHRKKVGFPVPISAWMFEEWADYAKSVLLDSNACTRGIYKQDQIEQLFRTPLSNRRRAARLLWTLLCFELWYKHVYMKATVQTQVDCQAQRNRHGLVVVN